MARAKRHYIPGQVWHITHRCHKREFLLGFEKDRRRWMQWLFEAKKRYGLIIYTAWSTTHIVIVSRKTIESPGMDINDRIEIFNDEKPYD